jgi:AhpD family alkylhydroperoxidase
MATATKTIPQSGALKPARLKHPVMLLPDAMQSLQAMGAAIAKAGVPARTLELVSLRASQINGCSVCTILHARDLKKAGESDDRLFAVAAWRDTPYFTDAERAALALTESVTRLADRSDAVPDEVWNEAAKHWTETQLAALVIQIALINAFNRINAAVRQDAGAIPRT